MPNENTLQIQEIERVFVYDKVTLQDPNPRLTPDQVLRHYSNLPGYQKLVTANVEGPELKNDQYVYTFKSTVGTKG